MKTITRFKMSYPYLYRSFIWTPILIFIALLTAGGGHGTHLFFTLIFPFSVLIPVVFLIEDVQLVDNVAMIFFVLPIIYGLILTIVERYRFSVKDTAIMIAIIHFSTAALCIIIPYLPF